ncbi:MAG TPA: helix-turn-helix domain-containing protein, partial [Gemmatimonadales bacterium]|nr:helix-turn-helix domain-containing protein [Gemmatimonadales bacterium]
ALERALVLAHGRTVRREDLPAAVLAPGGRPAEAGGFGADLTLRHQGDDLEQQLVREALLRSGGNRRKAAQLLGISVRALFYKLKGLGITDDQGQ